MYRRTEDEETCVGDGKCLVYSVHFAHTHTKLLLVPLDWIAHSSVEMPPAIGLNEADRSAV